MSGHWYDRQGNPCHFITGVDGTSRPATLRDARKLNLLPGFSGVDRMIHNHWLERWKKDQAVLAALTLARMPGEPDEDYLRRIDLDGSSRASEAASEGKAIHQAIEASFANEVYNSSYKPHVRAVWAILADNFAEVDDWVSERTFACPTGYGGAIDLHSPSHRVILDIKGADFGPDSDKRLTYTQHRQLAAYAHGLGWGLGTYRAGNVFVSRSSPGHVKYHEWELEELAEGLDTFLHALAIWCNVNKMQTRWEP